MFLFALKLVRKRRKNKSSNNNDALSQSSSSSSPSPSSSSCTSSNGQSPSRRNFKVRSNDERNNKQMATEKMTEDMVIRQVRGRSRHTRGRRGRHHQLF